MTAPEFDLSRWRFDRSRWLRGSAISSLVAAAFIPSMGCLDTSGTVDLTDDTSFVTEVSAEHETRAALPHAFATPDSVGGFSVDGRGVFLTAVDDTAELTLYVVAPAETGTFSRPALHLTSRDGDQVTTETAEFEDVTLRAGESRVFREEADGTLMEVVADFAQGPE